MPMSAQTDERFDRVGVIHLAEIFAGAERARGRFGAERMCLVVFPSRLMECWGQQKRKKPRLVESLSTEFEA